MKQEKIILLVITFVLLFFTGCDESCLYDGCPDKCGSEHAGPCESPVNIIGVVSEPAFVTLGDTAKFEVKFKNNSSYQNNQIRWSAQGHRSRRFVEYKHGDWSSRSVVYWVPDTFKAEPYNFKVCIDVGGSYYDQACSKFFVYVVQ